MLSYVLALVACANAVFVPGSVGVWAPFSPQNAPAAPLGALPGPAAALSGTLTLLTAAAPVQFDLATTAWSSLPALPTGFIGSDAVAYGGTLVVPGGPAPGSFSSLSWLSSTAWAAGWFTKPLLSGPATTLTAAAGDLLGGTYYLFGGADLSGDASNALYVLDLNAELAAPATPLGWKLATASARVAGVPAPRAGHSMNAYSDDLVIFGGVDGGAFFNDAWELTPSNAGAPVAAGGVAAALWTRLTLDATSPVPAPRAYHAAAMHSDELYVYGGVLGAAPTKWCTELWVLDVGAQAWAQVASTGVAPPSADGLVAGAFVGHALFLVVPAPTDGGAATLFEWTATRSDPASAAKAVSVTLPEAGLTAGLVINILLTIAVLAVVAGLARRKGERALSAADAAA